MRFLSLAVGITVASGLARAEPERAPPAIHIARAEAAVARGELREAIAEYEAAYAVEPAPSLLLVLSDLHVRLGERRLAAEVLNRNLDLVHVEDDLRETMLRRVNELHDVPSQLTIEVDPVGTEVRIDGESIGQSPLVRNLAAGSHEVKLSAPGYRMRSMRIALEYGEPITLGWHLAANEVANPNPTTDVASTAVTDVRAVQSDDSRPSWHLTLGGRWSLVPEDREGGWVGAFVGVRGLSDRVEVQAIAGEFGATIGRGIGGAARAYVATGRIAPFVSGAALFGSARGLEIGAGVVTKLRDTANGRIGFEAVLQAELLTIHGASPMAVGPARVVIPLTLGLAARL